MGVHDVLSTKTFEEEKKKRLRRKVVFFKALKRESL